MSAPLIILKAPAVFLGREASAVIDGIEEPQLRSRAIQAIQHCADALEAVDHLRLDEHEAAEELNGLYVWEQLAPAVRNVLVTVGRAGDRLKELFPVDEPLPSMEINLDEAFAEMEAMAAAPDPIRDTRDAEIDSILKQVQSTEVEVARAIDALASMLQRDFVSFGQRLRVPQVTADHWVLLGELQELKSKCQNCLEAVVATVVGAFAKQDLTAVLPRFRDATQRALRLRHGLVDLAHEVEQLNTQLKAQQIAPTTLRDALLARLAAFLESDAYVYVRPTDRRELARFRLAIGEQKGQVTDLLTLKQQVEGFEKFLDVARAVSRRDVLSHHDRSVVQTALMLWESEEDEDEVVAQLEEAYGRDPGLDRWLRDRRAGRPSPLEDGARFARQIDQRLRE